MGDSLVTPLRQKIGVRAYLVFGKIAVLHDDVHIRCAAGHRPRRVGDVGRGSLNVEVDALVPNSERVRVRASGDDVWRWAVSRGRGFTTLRGKRRVQGLVFQSNLAGD